MAVAVAVAGEMGFTINIEAFRGRENVFNQSAVWGKGRLRFQDAK